MIEYGDELAQTLLLMMAWLAFLAILTLLDDQPMKPPKYTDARRRYHTAEETRAPGYLARKFAAYRRLQRMQARRSQTNVQPLVKKAAK